MRGVDAAKSVTGSRWHAYIWGTLAALICPCHLPVLALLLSGTAAEAYISEHMGIAVLLLSVLFVLFLARALRALRDRP